MVKLFGFNISANTALALLLAGLGIFFYGLLVILSQYELMIVPANWADWYNATYWIVHFFGIGVGLYMMIVGIMGRKGKR